MKNMNSHWLLNRTWRGCRSPAELHAKGSWTGPQTRGTQPYGNPRHCSPQPLDSSPACWLYKTWAMSRETNHARNITESNHNIHLRLHEDCIAHGSNGRWCNDVQTEIRPNHHVVVDIWCELLLLTNAGNKWLLEHWHNEAANYYTRVPSRKRICGTCQILWSDFVNI